MRQLTATEQGREVKTWHRYYADAQRDVELYMAEGRTDLIGRSMRAIRDRFRSILRAAEAGVGLDEGDIDAGMTWEC